MFPFHLLERVGKCAGQAEKQVERLALERRKAGIGKGGGGGPRQRQSALCSLAQRGHRSLEVLEPVREWRCRKAAEALQHRLPSVPAFGIEARPCTVLIRMPRKLFRKLAETVSGGSPGAHGAF